MLALIFSSVAVAATWPAVDTYADPDRWDLQDLCLFLRLGFLEGEAGRPVRAADFVDGTCEYLDQVLSGAPTVVVDAEFGGLDDADARACVLSTPAELGRWRAHAARLPPLWGIERWQVEARGVQPDGGAVTVRCVVPLSMRQRPGKATVVRVDDP